MVGTFIRKIEVTEFCDGHLSDFESSYSENVDGNAIQAWSKYFFADISLQIFLLPNTCRTSLDSFDPIDKIAASE